MESSCDTCDRIRANLKKGTAEGLNNNIEDYSIRRSFTDMALSATTKQVAATYGGGLIGKGISYGLASYDAQKGTSTLTAPVYKSAFFVGNLAVGILTAVAAIHYGRKNKLSGSSFGVLVGAGTVATSELVDTLQKTVLGKRLTYAPQPRFNANVPRYNLSGVDTVIPAGKVGTYRGLT